MEILLVKTVAKLLLPPGFMIVLMLLGLALRKRFPRTGTTCFSSGFMLLVLASLPVISAFNMRLIEREPPLTKSELAAPSAEAIVVLGGGRIRNAPEYGHDIPSNSALQRLRYAAYLHRRTGLPILVSGGNVFNTTDSEASLMRDVLEKDFSTPVRWVEDQSRTTWENAVFSKAILQKAGIERVYVVTQASHMLRARIAFEGSGLKPVPAPTGFTPRGSDRSLIFGLLPDANALETNSSVMHELLGILWYKLRYIREEQPPTKTSPAKGKPQPEETSAGTPGRIGAVSCAKSLSLPNNK